MVAAKTKRPRSRAKATPKDTEGSAQAVAQTRTVSGSRKTKPEPFNCLTCGYVGDENEIDCPVCNQLDGSQIDEEILAWLVGVSADDINFKTRLEKANEVTIVAALKQMEASPKGNKVRMQRLRAALKRLQKAAPQSNKSEPVREAEPVANQQKVPAISSIDPTEFVNLETEIEQITAILDRYDFVLHDPEDMEAWEELRIDRTHRGWEISLDDCEVFLQKNSRIWGRWIDEDFDCDADEIIDWTVQVIDQLIPALEWLSGQLNLLDSKVAEHSQESAAKFNLGDWVRITGHPDEENIGKVGEIIEVENTTYRAEYQIELAPHEWVWAGEGWLESAPREEPEFVEACCEYGDYVRGQSLEDGSWIEGEVTSIGKKYVQLDSERSKSVLIGTIEILRPSIPEPELEEIVKEEEVVTTTCGALPQIQIGARVWNSNSDDGSFTLGAQSYHYAWIVDFDPSKSEYPYRLSFESGDSEGIYCASEEELDPFTDDFLDNDLVEGWCEKQQQQIKGYVDLIGLKQLRILPLGADPGVPFSKVYIDKSTAKLIEPAPNCDTQFDEPKLIADLKDEPEVTKSPAGGKTVTFKKGDRVRLKGGQFQQYGKAYDFATVVDTTKLDILGYGVDFTGGKLANAWHKAEDLEAFESAPEAQELGDGEILSREIIPTSDQSLSDGESLSLNDLAVRINEVYTQIEEAQGVFLRAARSALEHARTCGEWLLRAKEQVKQQGQKWEAWRDQNTCIPSQTASQYQRIAEFWEEAIAPVLDAGKVLTLREAEKLIQQHRGRLKPAQASSAEESSLPASPPSGRSWRLGDYVRGRSARDGEDHLMLTGTVNGINGNRLELAGNAIIWEETAELISSNEYGAILNSQPQPSSSSETSTQTQNLPATNSQAATPPTSAQPGTGMPSQQQSSNQPAHSMGNGQAGKRLSVSYTPIISPPATCRLCIHRQAEGEVYRCRAKGADWQESINRDWAVENDGICPHFKAPSSTEAEAHPVKLRLKLTHKAGKLKWEELLVGAIVQIDDRTFILKPEDLTLEAL